MDVADALRSQDAALFEARETTFRSLTVRLDALKGIEKAQESALELTRNEIKLVRYAQGDAVRLMEASRPPEKDEESAGHALSPLQKKQVFPSQGAPVEDLAATLAKNAAKPKCNVSTCTGAQLPGDVLCERCARARDARSAAALELAKATGFVREPNQDARVMRRPKPSG